MKLSNTKVQSFNRCQKQYEFSYVVGIEPKRRALPLERGSWIHSLLEAHYGDGPDDGDWKTEHKRLAKKFRNLFEEEREELGDLPRECARIMRSYLSRYREEDSQEETLAVELDEWVELPNGDTFNFVIDRIVRKADGGVWLRDYKTVGEFLPSDFMLLDAQLARYLWAFARLPDWRDVAKEVRGVEFDEIRTKAPTVPELVQGKKKGEDKILTRRANLDSDLFTYLSAIKRHGFDPKDYRDVLVRLKAQPDRFFRRTPMPKDRPTVKQMMVDMLVTAKSIKRAEASGNFPRTRLKNCRWDCDFLEPCITQLHGGHIEPIVELKYQKKGTNRDGERKRARDAAHELAQGAKR